MMRLFIFIIYIALYGKMALNVDGKCCCLLSVYILYCSLTVCKVPADRQLFFPSLSHSHSLYSPFEPFIVPYSEFGTYFPFVLRDIKWQFGWMANEKDKFEFQTFAIIVILCCCVYCCYCVEIRGKIHQDKCALTLNVYTISKWIVCFFCRCRRCLW